MSGSRFGGEDRWSCPPLRCWKILRSPEAAPAGLIATTTSVACAAPGSALAAGAASIAKGAALMMSLSKVSSFAIPLIVTCVVAGGAWVALAQPWREPAPPASVAPIAVNPVVATIDDEFPKLAPYADIRWRNDLPEVMIDDAWYELRSINDIPVADIIKFAQDEFGDRWQKRFSEDLVEVMTKMGQPPKETVKLVLRTLENGDEVTMDDVPMTKENRNRIWRRRNGQ
jgi:hypothetical protein